MFAHYEVLHELGAGAFGKVELVRDVTTGHERVMKTVSIEGMPAESVDLMKKEIAALQELDHPHIVRLYEYADIPSEQKLYLIIEKLPGGDGEALLKRRSSLSEALVARLITQVLSATAYCHARGIIHRDMKPENVMLTSKEKGDSIDCKVIDFGLAASFEHSRPRQQQEICGTPAYMAPEVVDESRLSGPKQDVWSIGVIAFKWLTGSLPFGDPTDYANGMPGLFAAIKAYEGLDNDERWEDRSDDCFDFVQSLMSLSLDNRPSCAEALQHTWIEEKRAKLSPITREMLQSIDGYARSPLLTRACLLLVASRMDASQLDDIRHTFMQLDLDGSGDLCWDEISDAADSASMWCNAEIDLREAFDGADMDHSGRLEYSEFVAACLFSQFCSYRGQDLAKYAFQAFDEDAKGEVTREQVRQFFQASSCGDNILQCLPDHPFDAEEFYRCLRDGTADESDDDGDDVTLLASPRTLRESRNRPQGFFACCA